ncbi:17913_t:CDS:2, partial [Funneliformis geosporum]
TSGNLLERAACQKHKEAIAEEFRKVGERMIALQEETKKAREAEMVKAFERAGINLSVRSEAELEVADEEGNLVRRPAEEISEKVVFPPTRENGDAPGQLEEDETVMKLDFRKERGKLILTENERIVIEKPTPKPLTIPMLSSSPNS